MKYQPVFRPILNKALKAAWRHKEVWPVAAVAGLAGTGAILNDVIHQSRLAFQLNQPGLLGLDRLLATNWNVDVWPAKLALLSLVVIILLTSIVVLIASSQQAVLQLAHQVSSRTKQLSWLEIQSHLLHPRVWRILGLDLFAKLLLINILILTTKLVSWLNLVNFFDGLFGLIFMSSALVLVFFVNILTMLALIGVTKHDYNLKEAFNYAGQLFNQHPVICLEMASLLFAVNFILTAGYAMGLLLLAVPVFVVLNLTLASGSLILTSLFMFLATIGLIAFTVAWAGFTTTFTYINWSLLAEYLIKHPQLSPRLAVHGKRLLAQVRS